jgi:hypothetical protein
MTNSVQTTIRLPADYAAVVRGAAKESNQTFAEVIRGAVRLFEAERAAWLLEHHEPSVSEGNELESRRAAAQCELDHARYELFSRQRRAVELKGPRMP